jgi:hemolysin activation/secretion protein
MGEGMGEWRIYVFSDNGVLSLRNPLPEQKSHFHLASIGLGGRVRLRDHFNGSLDAGVPLVGQAETKTNELRFTFRLWADF